jgi:hypothetical membrane protein
MLSSVRIRAGALCWVAALPLFLAANLVVGLRWQNPRFSWSDHNISDLGNVTCGIWDTSRPRLVCSPWHTAMNTALITTALLLVAGFVLAWRRWRTGQWLMVLGAAGLGLAGAFPADRNENMHVLGALLVFAAGNIGLLIAGLHRRAPLRLLTLGLGLLGVIASALFIARQGLGLGVGGMERVAVFPLPVWACCAGLRCIREARSPRPARVVTGLPTGPDRYPGGLTSRRAGKSRRRRAG